jgi:hypothetical protein
MPPRGTEPLFTSALLCVIYSSFDVVNIVRKGRQTDGSGLKKCAVFWDVALYSPVEGRRYFGGTIYLHLQERRVLPVNCFVLVPCMDYSSTLKMEAVCSFKTSVNIYRTTRCHIPEARTCHSHHCENLKPRKICFHFPAGARDFQFFRSVQTGFGKILASYSMVARAVLQG